MTAVPDTLMPSNVISLDDRRDPLDLVSIRLERASEHIRGASSRIVESAAGESVPTNRATAPPADPNLWKTYHYPRSPKAQHRMVVESLRKASREFAALAKKAEVYAVEAEAIAATRKGWNSKRARAFALQLHLLNHCADGLDHWTNRAARNAEMLCPLSLTKS